MPTKDPKKRKQYEQKYEKSERGKSIRKKYKLSEKGVSMKKKVYKKSYEKLKSQGYYLFGYGAYAKIKHNCELKHRPFTMTQEEFENWWKSQPDHCYYCGITSKEYKNLKDLIINYKGKNPEVDKFKSLLKTSTHKKIENLTIDRKNNLKTYTPDNMAKCCWFCNSIKGSILTEDNMLSIARNILDKLRKAIAQTKDEWLGPGIKRVEKGWGWEDWIWNSGLYCGKKLHFNKDKKCSFHYHLIKEETFYLHSGTIIVKYGYEDDINKAEEVTLYPGYSFFIPIGMRHQMIAIEESDLFEFSTTHLDSDSYRILKGD